MSDYGLKCWDSERNSTLDVTDKISRVRFQTEVSGGVTASIVLADISGKSVAAIGLALESGKTAHAVSIKSGTIVRWKAHGTVLWPSSDTLVQVFLYD